VRLEEGPTAVHVNMRHGTVVSVLSTASGRLFAAFKPREEVQAALRLEPKPAPRIDKAIEANLAHIRQERFCALVDGSLPGITALAAPVFDGFGEIVLALTVIGPNATLSPEREAPAGRALRQAAAELSARLGSRPRS
jgi:DNA-binding IclR family transcriptional regulator